MNAIDGRHHQSREARADWERRHPTVLLDRAGRVGSQLSVFGAWCVLMYRVLGQAWLMWVAEPKAPLRTGEDTRWSLGLAVALGVVWLISEALHGTDHPWVWPIARVWGRLVGALTVAAGVVAAGVGICLAAFAAWLVLERLGTSIRSLDLRIIGLVIIGLLVLILLNGTQRR